MRHRTQVVASYFNTPGSADRRLFHAVIRTGHLKAAPDYRIDRQSYPGHDLLLCMAGAGYVRTGGRDFRVQVGQLAWVDCGCPHAHWPDGAHPWELSWMRVEGPQIDAIAEALEVQRDPIFSLADTDQASQLFKQSCALMRERSLTMNVALHAAVGCLIRDLFRSRQGEGSRKDREAGSDPHLRKVLDLMRRQCERPWRIKELARIGGLSIPHFFRRFRKATGSSPIEWLRQERVNRAKRRLSETRDPIKDIALQVGYDDPFYFSRDFKRLVGSSPRQYRDQEQVSER